MASYVVVACGKCGEYLLAKTGQKTRTCPYCGSKIPLEKVPKLAVAKTASEASAMLRRIKEKKAERRTKARIQGLF